MYKVKLFNEERIDLLQNAVNEWLHENKDILVHSSNLSGSKDSGEYIFFILYSGPDEQAEELKEMAAAVTQDQSIEVREINPEIMKPSS
jgi:hypothetical protein